jgi:hypothetical protein
MLDLEGKLPRGEPPIEWGEYQPGSGTGKKRDNVLRAVVGEDSNPVPLAKAELVELGG